MIHRHLEVPEGTPVEELGPASLDDLLDRGDLSDWAPLARAVAADPYGPVADSVLRLCGAHPMYGTSELWRAWIEHLRSRPASAPVNTLDLSALRRSRGLSQAQLAQRLGIAQSDVSKLERRADVRLSTLRSAVQAMGGTLRIEAEFGDGSKAGLAIGRPPEPQ